MFSEFHFLRAEWLSALLPLIAVTVWALLRKLRKGNWSRIVDPQLQEHVLMQHQSQRNSFLPYIFALAGMLAIIAMAGPSWQRLPLPVFQDESSLVIALDLSRSMDAQDIKPSRLQRARLKLIDILRQRKLGQTALITYAADAYIVTPLTDDVETIITHVPNLNTDLMPAQGSRADLAIAKAIELLQQTNTQQGDVLLLTDGVEAKQLEDAANKLREQGHRLLILGVGTIDGAPIPAPGSGFVKDRSGGIVIAKLNENELTSSAIYHRMTIDDSDIHYLFNNNAPELFDMEHKAAELNADTWRDEGPWLLLPLLLLIPFAFRRGILTLGLLCLIPIPEPAQAFTWQHLFYNNDQRASLALEQGEAERAAKLFEDPAWRAAAQFRAGQYEKAVETLTPLTDTDSLYNKGNALAKLGKIPEAIQAYNKVLETDPEHEDARYNRDLLQQQQQQQNQQQNADRQNQQSQQDQSQQQESESDQQQNNAADSQESESEPAEPEQQQAQEQQQTQEQQQAQQAQAQEQQEPEPEEQSQQQEITQQTEPDAEQQAIEQWLRRVPDDPGGLLRRKFRYQHNQQNHRQESKPW